MRLRLLFSYLALALATLGCSVEPSSPAATGSRDASPSGASSADSSATIPEESGSAALSPPPAIGEEDLRLSCGSPLAFNAEALGGPGGAEAARHPAADALRDLLSDDHLADREGWRIVVLTDATALFLLPARPGEGFAYWNAEFERREGTWEYVRSGQCDIGPVFEGIGPARWDLAPGQKLTRDSRQMEVLVTELACASGQSPAGRIVPAAAIYQERSILVIFGVQPLPGAQTCQSGPPAAATLELEEAIGDRQLLDGSVLPPEFRGSAP